MEMGFYCIRSAIFMTGGLGALFEPFLHMYLKMEFGFIRSDFMTSGTRALFVIYLLLDHFFSLFSYI